LNHEPTEKDRARLAKYEMAKKILLTIPQELPKPVLPPGTVRRYTLDGLLQMKGTEETREPGSMHLWHDVVLKKWRLTIQLDPKRIWFLSVFIRDDGTFDKFSLDEELASDSHYEFDDEDLVRKRLFREGDQDLYLHEILIRCVEEQGGNNLLHYIPVTASYHFD
ncbi:MAG: hypothetical protein IJH77_00265, partial [Mogibacterium sp.]|nr:hypothetical protein [Mogibacterium sp.]